MRSNSIVVAHREQLACKSFRRGRASEGHLVDIEAKCGALSLGECKDCISYWTFLVTGIDPSHLVDRGRVLDRKRYVHGSRNLMKRVTRWSVMPLPLVRVGVLRIRFCWNHRLFACHQMIALTGIFSRWCNMCSLKEQCKCTYALQSD